MIVISNINTHKFSLNGIPYWKNFMSIVFGDQLKIVNAYDSKLCLSELKEYTQYSVNGVIHVNVEDLQSALLPILYSRNTLGGAVPMTPYNATFIFDETPQTVPAGFEGIVTNLNNIYAELTFTVVGTVLTVTGGADTGEKLLINGKY